MKLVNQSIKRLGMLVAALASVASLNAAAFSFSSGGSNVGGTSDNSDNTRTFTSGSISVDVTAWSQLGQGTAFTRAFVGQYGASGSGNDSEGGLGVTNDNEQGDGSPEHKADNLSSFDYLLFKFNGAVAVDSIDLRSVGGDSDFRYWIGNSALAPTVGNLSGFISGALFTTDSLIGHGNSRVGDINNTPVYGNYLLLAPVPSSSDDDDEFKVYGAIVNGTVPDNGSTLALLGLGLVGMVALRKRFRA